MKQNIARPNQDKVRPNWEQIKDQVMEWCVASKLVQHPSIRETLHGTGNAHIVEYSSKDHYWGASKVNGQWQGHNWQLANVLERQPSLYGCYCDSGATPAYKRNEPKTDHELSEVVEQVVETNIPEPTPEPERDMTKVLKDRAELLEYVMQRRNSKDKA